MIKSGDRLECESMGTLTVGKSLGAGMQGQVFHVDSDQGPAAVKRYYPAMATPGQRAGIKAIIGAQLQDPRLLWPRSFLVKEGDASFGYVMPLRPPDFIPLSRVIKGVVPIDFQLLVRSGIGLVGAYRTIQVNGLAYRDIKDPNVFIRPATGDVLVCDNDNAVAQDSISQIKGTTDFCARELLVGGANPNSVTDLHSLAVLLFFLLVRGHPLGGAREAAIRCLDEAARVHLYGVAPSFIFDPAPDANRPVQGLHDGVIKHWSIWPDDLKALWMRAFTAGLRDPSKRPTLLEWMAALGRAQDSLRRCASCGSRTVAPTATAAQWECWNCHAAVQPGPRCQVHDRVILLDPGAAVFQHHLDNRPADANFDQPVLSAVAHPTDPTIIGLRNDTSKDMSYTRKDGSSSQIPPGGTAMVADGASLVTSQGTIRMRV